MILSIKIKNFQSHKDTQMDLCEGLNVIIGKSDSGKSAIRRALYWVCKNRPTGDSFVSWWGGPTIVELHLSSGDVVSRIKEGNKNLYKINDQEFAAFGTDVPKEVQDILNINDVNLQAQFDRPFLLDATSGEVASHFNKIAKIDIIDSSIKKVSTWQKGLEKDKTINEGILENLKSQKSKLDFVEKLDIELSVLEQMYEDYENKIKENSKLKKCAEDLISIESEIRQWHEFLEIETLAQPLFATLNQVQEYRKEHKKLSEAVNSLHELEQSIRGFKGVLVMEEDIVELQEFLTEKEKTQSNLLNLNSLLNQLRQINITVTKKKGIVKELTEQFEKEFPAICPLCGNPKKVKGEISQKGWSTVSSDETPMLDKAIKTNETNHKTKLL